MTDDDDNDNDRRVVHVDGVLTCPDHRGPLIIFSVKTVDGASPRYLFSCPEPLCQRMLRVVAKCVSEVTLLSVDGKKCADGGAK